MSFFLIIFDIIILAISMAVSIDTFRKSDYLLRTIFSFWIALSAAGLLFIILLFFHLQFYWFLISLSLLSLLFVTGTKFKPPRIQETGIKLISINTTVILALLIIQAMLFINKSYRWGDWDAWAIWNLHARFLFSDHSWTNMFADKIAWTHPDYPLFLPSIIVMFWKGAGDTLPLIPSVVAYLILLCIPISIYSSLKKKNLSFPGIAAFIIFTIDRYFILRAASQFADTLLALFILLTIILISNSENNSKNLLLTGLFASVCGWIKNEGLIFFIITTFFIIIHNYKNVKFLLHYFYGAILPLSVILIFKFWYAPPNDIIGRQGNGILIKIMSFDRYYITFVFFIRTIVKLYPILIIILIYFIIYYRYFSKSASFLILLLTMAGYFSIYIITPRDLHWHLENSCNRVIHQLYPSFIYIFFNSAGPIILSNLSGIKKKFLKKPV